MADATVPAEEAKPAPTRNWSSILSQPAPVRKPGPIGPRPVATVVTGAHKKDATADGVELTQDKSDTEAVSPDSRKKRFNRPSLAEQQQAKKTILILDSGAIIKGVRVERLGSEFWTIREVIDEIRDSKARDFLQTFPYEIKTTEPDPQDMRAVVEFAKKTGDYASLSAVDMKVIALTRTFERENNGVEHLRAAPLPPTLVSRNKKTHADKPEGQAQWGGAPALTAPRGGSRGRGGLRGGPRGGGRGRGAHPHPHPSQPSETHPAGAAAEEKEPATQEEEEEPKEEVQGQEGPAKETNTKQEKESEREVEEKEKESEKEVEEKEEEKAEEEKEVTTEAQEETAAAETADVITVAEETAKEQSTDAEVVVVVADVSEPQQQHMGGGGEEKPESKKPEVSGEAAQHQPRSRPPSRRNSTTPAPRAPVAKEDQDDNAGWITPDNIGQMKRSAARISSLDDLVKRTKAGVACITTDYAMQNVLIQMGLHLLSADGMVIKKLRTYLLQCHACFKTTKEMEKVFCPNCGHQTLRKVPYTLDERTGQPILLANRVSRPVSARGTKFSLPLPKGGRHEQKLILREDELLEKTHRKKKKNKEVDDAFDEDHGFLQPRQQNQAKFVVGKSKKNPNESHRRTGKRKKNSGTNN